MKKFNKHDFYVKHFKKAIMVLVVLLAFVAGWTGYFCIEHPQMQNFQVVATQAPMTQNQIETLAEQLGVPKTQQAVAKALQQQQQGQVVGNINYGKVAIASLGPGLGYPVAPEFGTSPYFLIFDAATNTYEIKMNPNINVPDQDIQTGQYVTTLGATNVIAGNFTKDALTMLQLRRVNVYAGITGPVQNVLDAYMKGTFLSAN